MTKEEYQRDLIRMWDSLRSTTYKGEKTCKGITCFNCPFNGELCNAGKQHPYEIIEVVENWAEQHPIVTNADKFREMFGTEPSKHTCVNVNIQCEDCKYFVGGCCAASTKFWDAEYKGGVDGE